MKKAIAVLAALVVVGLGSTPAHAIVNRDFGVWSSDHGGHAWGSIDYYEDRKDQLWIAGGAWLDDVDCDGLGVRARYLVTFKNGEEDSSGWFNNGNGCQGNNVSLYYIYDFNQNIDYAKVRVCTVLAGDNQACGTSPRLDNPYVD